MKTLEFGKPAEWAAKQKWKRRGEAAKSYALIAFIVLAVAAVTLAALFTDLLPPVAEIIIVLAVALAGGAFVVLNHKTAAANMKKASQADVGVKSERAIRRVVRRNRPLAALYGAVLGKRQGDVDLIVIDRGLRLASVEIKTGFGHVKVDGNQVRAGRRVMPRDPLGQCQKAARRVTDAMGAYATPVLCIPGMTNKPFMHDDILVTNGKDLFRALSVLAAASFETPDEAEAAAKGVWRRHLTIAA